MNSGATPIIRRRVNIPFPLEKARGWRLDRKDVEAFLNAISYIFPPGETFFIHSVQNYVDRITDPVLQDQVKRFIYQEAMHTKEHNRCNDALNTAYPNAYKIEKFAAASLRITRLLLPRISQLACSTALEHFTAILADSLLRNQESFIADSDPDYASLWLWHAVEEAEHKAVCFDVYQQFAGKGVFSHLHRVTVMFATSIYFIFTMFVALRLLNKGKKVQEDKPRATPAGQAASASPPGRRSLWRILSEILSPRLYFDYYRYSFHPWDHDNTLVIQEWKKRYKDFGGKQEEAHGHGTA